MDSELDIGYVILIKIVYAMFILDIIYNLYAFEFFLHMHPISYNLDTDICGDIFETHYKVAY